MKKITLLLGLMLMAFSYQANAQITVGSGTGTQSNVPIVSCYGYTYSQQLYLQPEINSSGNITSVAFYVSSVPTTNDESTDWTISMGHSTKTEFADTADWEEASGLTEVYTGTVAYPEAGNWMTITFDTPFAYNNTDNLIVAIDENQTGYDCTINWQKTDTAENRSIYYRNDSTNPDPASPPSATGIGAYYANTIFGGLTASLPPNCDAVLTAPVDGEMNAGLNAGLAWSAATGSPDGYKVTLGTSTGATDIADAVDVGTDLTYAVTLMAGTTYFATITPYNANGDATGCTEVSFTAVDVPECPVVTGTPDAACGNFDSNLSWVAIAAADSYTVSVGTSAGATDIADNVDVGSALTYDFVSSAATTYYYTVNAVNTAGTSSGCIEGSFTTFANGCYCDSMPSSNDATGIGSLQVGTTDFTSGGDLTYEDFTGTAVDLGQGISANVMIGFETGYTYNTNIWIDLNDDLIFDDATELFYSGESAAANPSTLDASFMMPATATLGTHRMRIGTADSGQATPNSCYSGSYGVTMDVDVNIIAVSCTPPTGTATLVTDCDNAQFSVDVDVTGLGDGTSQINDGTTTYAANALGIVTVGPYADGTSIALVIENGTDATCDLDLGTFTNTCPIAGQLCSSAIDITSIPYTTTDNTANYFDDYENGSSPCSAYYMSGDDVFYSYSPIITQTYRVSLTGIDASYSGLHIWDGCIDGATAPACVGFLGSSNTVDRIIDVELAAGTTYYIAISTWAAPQSVGYTLNIDVAPPANDECAGAEALTLDLEITADNTGATDSSIAADCFTGTISDLWYSFVATSTTEAYIATTAVQYGVYSDCAGTEVMGCNTSPITGLVDGDTYYIRINDDGATVGPESFTLEVSDTEILSVSDFSVRSLFTYYPNPVNNTLTLNAQKAITNVAVFNMLGQEVIKSAPNAVSKAIDMSNLKSGAYFVKVTVGTTVETIRVIKN
ncbi:T9SS type A sorting domain-containing protein [uncultured Lacinutrix sp.]|uniref:T9SS type A sorting domain-containing protein n=1 Tax=uncultured Lacinutrix sp. TaxID=574032 RepID=UPI002612C5B9|nr:T9SS type A sorting domain-containing protein [uncultured Lacinutrix sp.]